MLDRAHQENRNARNNNGKRRRRRTPGSAPGRHHPPVPLTSEGMPAATPDSPAVSPVVFVSDESRALHPWLPPRVIAGSVWRGPGHQRLRVDEHGNAQPWKKTVRVG
jgi:hypothetical protein